MTFTMEDIYKQVKKGHINIKTAMKLIQKIYENENPKSQEKYLKMSFSFGEAFLKDHLVLNKQVLLGGTYCDLTFRQIKALNPEAKIISLINVQFEEPIILNENQKVNLYVKIENKNNKRIFKNCFQYNDALEEKISCSGQFTIDEIDNNHNINLEELFKNYLDKIEKTEIYNNITGVHLGSSLQVLKRIYTYKDNSALGILSMDELMKKDHPLFDLHPAILNAAFMTVSAIHNSHDAFIPFIIKEIKMLEQLPNESFCRTQLVKKNDEIIECNIDIVDSLGKILIIIKGAVCKRVRLANNNYIKSDLKELNKDNNDTMSNEILNDDRIADILVSQIRYYLKNKLALDNKVDIQKNIMDLNIDSLKLLQITKEIEEELSIELHPTLFFEYQNISELSQYFAKEYKNEFSKIINNNGKHFLPQSLINIEANNIATKENSINIEKKSADNNEKLELQSSTARSSHHSISLVEEDIAIIGMSGMFSHADNVEEFWSNIVNHKEVITEIPLSHWDYRPWFDEDPQVKDKTYCKWGSFISDVSKFDAGFFNISPVEAEVMDPQLRLLLQVIYETIEDAGYARKIRKSNTGIYVGTSFADYLIEFNQFNNIVSPYMGSGNAASMLANRPSFFLDLTGPSLVIDTACSASLVALHFACQSLMLGECEMAFVCGTNLLLTSWHYRYFSSIGALSPTGRCYTFDNRADGYVPGEAIACILLKPLKKAIHDGDQIHAIIKGSAVNHGGYTPSVTAPSVNQEADVLLKAWKAAKIDPNTISYIEAHGTGTKLGDPVEIKAIKKAFSSYNKVPKSCAIGSAKASIGHAEGAAGIVGLIKVILSMKHKKIPSMPHFQELNSFISLDDSPLYINQKTEEWTSKDFPRRAGVSAFGFGGAYAHVILEEAPEINKVKIDVKSSLFLIVVSAKQDISLKQNVSQLKEWLDKNDDIPLIDVCYTLSIGRSHFSKRCAFIASSISELKIHLSQFINNESSENIYISPKSTTINHEDQENDKIFIQLIKKISPIHELVTKESFDDLKKLATYYINGYEINWELLYESSNASLVSLPTYSFLKEHYWMEVASTTKKEHASTLHPLLDKNISTFDNPHCFSKLLHQDEFYLKDHQVKQVPVFPGVAYLEMAFAAGNMLSGGDKVLSLSNIVWLRPIILTKETSLTKINLYPIDKGAEFEVTTHDEEILLHAQGKIHYTSPFAAPLEKIDVTAIKSRCPKIVDSDSLYAQFKNQGLQYGSSFQTIQTLWCDEHEALAKLRLPAALTKTASAWTLHPSVLDGLLQTVSGLLRGDSLYLPFSLDRLTILGDIPEECYSYVKHNVEDQGELKKFQVQLLDESGNVIIAIQDFAVRALQAEDSSTHYYRPVWRESELSLSKTALSGSILMIGFAPTLKEALANRLALPFAQSVEEMPRYIVHRFAKEEAKSSFNTVFNLIQSVLQAKPKNPVTWIGLYEEDEEDIYISALSGLLKTASQENSHWQGRLIRIDEKRYGDVEFLSECLALELTAIAREVRYEDQRRYVKQFESFIAGANDNKKTTFRKQGVYLITGGAGGLGLIFAGYLARQYQAKLILMGRSTLNEEQTKKMALLQSFGGEVLYVRGDVSKREDVKRVLNEGHKRFGELHGIIHSAGVIKDALIIKKSLAETESVMGPKILGTLHLDDLTQEMSLDCFILFSSIASVFGNLGQCDYSYANSFIDNFAEKRRTRHNGITLSVNWPLWEEGGMQIDAETKAWITRLGAKPLTNEAGLAALEYAITMTDISSAIVVFAGKKFQLEKQLQFAAEMKIPHLEQMIKPIVNDDGLLGQVSEQITNMISRLLKIKVVDLDVSQELNEYGMDSISGITLINTISTFYNIELSPAVLFEYTTINAVANYLLTVHQEKIRSYYQECLNTGSKVSINTLVDMANSSPFPQITRNDNEKVNEIENENNQKNNLLNHCQMDYALKLNSTKEIPLEYQLKIENYTKKLFKPNIIIKMLKNMMRSIFRHIVKSYFDIQIRGLENLPQKGAFLICGNHTSGLDPVIIDVVTYNKLKGTVGLGAEDLFFKKNYELKFKFKLLLLKYLIDIVPFDRTNKDNCSLQKNILFAEICKKYNRPMILFPEGTRSLDGEIQEFKSGIGLLASELKLPIIPTYIEGPFHLLPKGKLVPKRGKIIVSFGLPQDFDSITNRSDISNVTQYQEIAKEIREKVINLKDSVCYE